jgi:plasmid stability protein
MRTTILLDDELAESFRAKARANHQSLSAFLAEAGRAALKSESSPSEIPFDLFTYGKSGVQAGVNLDRTNELLAGDDEESYGS